MQITKEEFLKLVKETFAELPENTVHLPEENVDIAVLEEPLTGFADAADPLFEQYKDPAVIGENFKTPKEWMPEARTVVGFFFPFTGAVRFRHRASTELTDEAWNNGYPKGMQMAELFLDILIEKLEKAGVKTHLPHRDPGFTMNPVPVMNGEEEDLHFSAAWSNRHALYAAGLGTFGVHRHIITDKGCCGTLASLLADVKLEPTPRGYTGLYDNCIRCGACTHRCPAKAITLEGLRNLKKCAGHSGVIRETLGGGFCGKCLVGVPCEDRNPAK